MESKSKVLVFGSGQVGRALTQTSPTPCLQLTREQADFTCPDKVIAQLDLHRPGVVLNAVAYTAVDKAEVESELAFQINAETPGKIAQWCKQNNAIFVHFSTDYVYPGDGEQAYSEENPTGPLNVYGHSKLAGDQAIEQVGGKYLIFRTSWVYDFQGQNFVLTMLKLAHEKSELSVVNDQVGSPTYADDLATIVWRALEVARAEANFPSGVYHLCGQGFASWYEFANEIFKRAPQRELKIKKVMPVGSQQFPRPAQRPLNSRLSQQKFMHTFKLQMPSWQESLQSCLRRVYASHDL